MLSPHDLSHKKMLKGALLSKTKARKDAGQRKATLQNRVLGTYLEHGKGQRGSDLEHDLGLVCLLPAPPAQLTHRPTARTKTKYRTSTAMSPPSRLLWGNASRGSDSVGGGPLGSLSMLLSGLCPVKCANACQGPHHSAPPLHGASVGPPARRHACVMETDLRAESSVQPSVSPPTCTGQLDPVRGDFSPARSLPWQKAKNKRWKWCGRSLHPPPLNRRASGSERKPGRPSGSASHQPPSGSRASRQLLSQCWTCPQIGVYFINTQSTCYTPGVILSVRESATWAPLPPHVTDGKTGTKQGRNLPEGHSAGNQQTVSQNPRLGHGSKLLLVRGTSKGTARDSCGGQLRLPPGPRRDVTP